MAKWYCYSAGNKYGPIEESELRAWVRAGRLLPSDLIWSEGMADWIAASSALPDLFVGGQNLPATPPPLPSQYGDFADYSHLKPHRGGAVLALGICGIAVIFVCGIIAWVMGNEDLKEMDAGRMDPTGRGITKAGKICGIIGCCFAIAWAAFVLIYLVIIFLVLGAFATGAS